MDDHSEQNPYQAPLQACDDVATVTLSRRHVALHRLCAIVGAYGLLVGCLGIGTAWFIGPQLLIGFLVHAGLGVGFLISATGLQREKTWAPVICFRLAVITIILGILATIRSMRTQQIAAAAYWIGLVIVFGVLAYWSQRCITLRPEAKERST